MKDMNLRIAFNDILNKRWLLVMEEGEDFSLYETPFGGIFVTYYNILRDCFGNEDVFYFYTDDPDYEIFYRNVKEIINDYKLYCSLDDPEGYSIWKKKYDDLEKGYLAFSNLFKSNNIQEKKEIYEKYKYFFSEIIYKSSDKLLKKTPISIGNEIVNENFTEIFLCETYCDLISLDLPYYIFDENRIRVKECTDCKRLFIVTDGHQERCPDCRKENDKKKSSYKIYAKNPIETVHKLINDRLSARKGLDYEKYNNEYKRIKKEKESEEEVIEWLLEKEIETRIRDVNKKLDPDIISSIIKKYPKLIKWFPEYNDACNSGF